MSKNFVAVDLGAESGRVILGQFGDGQLQIQEIHRFATGHTWIQGTMRWDVLRFWDEIQQGLAKCPGIDSVSVDSWGVDYVWLRRGEPMITLPFHYRDARTADGYQRLASKISQTEIYQDTGIQMMELNTLVQLHEDLLRRPQVFAESDFFLTIGDYFNHLLGGRPCIEESLASTTQLYNTKAKKWSQSLISKLALPLRVFPEVVPSGTVLGSIDDSLCKHLGAAHAKIVATCSHDTGAAVAAVPSIQTSDDWAYLSSGTWSLLGVELASPCITKESELEGFTNEIGFAGTIRFLKNIVGLWIVQECRRAWGKSNPDLDYAKLTQLASVHMNDSSLIRPDDQRFYKPGDMPQKIQDYCRETDQQPPNSIGEITACVLRSLACLYAEVLAKVEKLTNRTIHTLHIVGGGSRNTLLNQAAADYTGRRVLAGPAEATACGNLLLQALALGRISSLQELRTIVLRSQNIEEFKPAPKLEVEKVLTKFRELKK